jgi:BirA family biotin operon repressor/biotin-[acetyl-CoA-carboxylase] ligase
MSTFDAHRYLSLIQTQWLGRVLNYREAVDSTNTWAKQDRTGQDTHGALFITDDQQQGRGQYDRKWDSSRGQNLTFSLVLRPAHSDRLTVLTLAFALALVKTHQAHQTREQPSSSIKWPNDVRCLGQKWVGILTETVFSGNRMDRLVIGLGINVNQITFPGSLRNEATSLRQLTGQIFKREELLAEICGRLEYQYRRWYQQDPALIEEINVHLDGVEEWCQIKLDGQLLSEPSWINGINEQGHLRLTHKNGEQQDYSYEQIRIITD